MTKHVRHDVGHASSHRHDGGDTMSHKPDVDHGATYGQDGDGSASGGDLTRLAVSATLHCLTGCAIGEVLGMVLGTWWGWSEWATVALAVGLAFFFGYALTIGPVLRAKVGFRRAVKVALAADTVSIAVMEFVDNAIMLTVPGAMESGLASFLFWGSLAFSLFVAFVVTVPVNRWLIGRGRGHAVVHSYH